MNDEEPQYICLNYCMVDQETGHCLTCGRPPLPPPPPMPDFSQKTFAGIALKGTPVSEAKSAADEGTGEASK